MHTYVDTDASIMKSPRRLLFSTSDGHVMYYRDIDLRYNGRSNNSNIIHIRTLSLFLFLTLCLFLFLLLSLSLSLSLSPPFSAKYLIFCTGLKDKIKKEEKKKRSSSENSPTSSPKKKHVKGSNKQTGRAPPLPSPPLPAGKWHLDTITKGGGSSSLSAAATISPHPTSPAPPFAQPQKQTRSE
ncbi:hypothetical protein F4779DRAFT_277899 [Xylariaceae sp. FL0662B]|nr:hypothetical protein F4779DRAFT_277899 [Xylariaceae sp. FL0662B]